MYNPVAINKIKENKNMLNRKVKKEQKKTKHVHNTLHVICYQELYFRFSSIGRWNISHNISVYRFRVLFNQQFSIKFSIIFRFLFEIFIFEWFYKTQVINSKALRRKTIELELLEQKTINIKKNVYFIPWKF